MRIKILFSLSALILFNFFFSYSGDHSTIMVNSSRAQGVLESLEQNITQLVESVKPSLVTIEAEIYTSKGKKVSSITSFVGSGVIYSADGLILTSSSVVGGMENFKVRLFNRKEYKAKLVGTDNQTNLAVLKVDADGLKKARFGNSDKVKEGSWVTVVGNSYGIPTAVSFGIVNGITRDSTIQMNVNVSPGNSGGPVLNIRGEVIGLVSAKLSETSYLNSIKLYEEKSKQYFAFPPTPIEIPSSGISLAIPINLVHKKADWIIKHGKSIAKGYLGVYLEDFVDQEGVLIVDVVEGTPADKAGLKDEDAVIGFNQDEVKDSDHFRKLIGSSLPGEMVNLRILREGKEKLLAVKLGSAGSIYSQQEAINIPPEVKELDEFSDENLPEIELMYKGAYEKSQEIYEKELEQILNQSLDNVKKELKRLSKELERLKKEIEESKEKK
ncbi:MAG: S1C family serine protease [candidate division Zixibacteria bacterium]|nr:S1C family serine protease [candidate division Zixibacteria bacterium]